MCSADPVSGPSTFLGGGRFGGFSTLSFPEIYCRAFPARALSKRHARGEGGGVNWIISQEEMREEGRERVTLCNRVCSSLKIDSCWRIVGFAEMEPAGIRKKSKSTSWCLLKSSWRK